MESLLGWRDEARSASWLREAVGVFAASTLDDALCSGFVVAKDPPAGVLAVFTLPGLALVIVAEMPLSVVWLWGLGGYCDVVGDERHELILAAAVALRGACPATRALR
jgi:hypothetical protein